MKIIINKCYGGFGLSNKALKLFFKEKYGVNTYVFKRIGRIEHRTYERVPEDQENDKNINTCLFDTENPTEDSKEIYSRYEIKRTDPILIDIVETLGEESFGHYAKLAIIEIPDDVEWEIEDYDGVEWVAEKHRTWQ